MIAGLAVTATAAAAGVIVIGDFGGPLFGLTTGRQGELLVADASVGIIPIRRGEPGEPIELPGVTDVDVDAFGLSMWAVTGSSGGPAGGQIDSGQGLHLISNGKARKVANLFEFEKANNPVPPASPVESNPFDVQALGPHAALVADAAGNSLLRIDRSGDIKVLAVFPNEIVSTANIKKLAACPSPAPFCGFPDMMPAQPVPTSIAVDRHGFIYVGELKGIPAPTGESNIWRVAPWANKAVCGESRDCVKVFDGGFTSIIDLAFGPSGLLYVTELDEASWAAVEIFQKPTRGTINACSVKWGYCLEVEDDFTTPTAVTFDKNGALWATRNAVVPGAAEVVKVRDGWRRWWRHPRHFSFGDD